MRLLQDDREWTRVLALYGTPRRPRSGPDGEQLWIGPAERQRIDIVRPGRTCRLVIVSPKSQPIAWWFGQDALPGDVATFVSPTPSERRGLSLVEALAGRAKAAFVCDLDPPALVQFVEMQRAAAGRVRVFHAGLNDACLEEVEAGLKRRWRLEQLLIRLARDERDLLARLERAIDLERLVGPRSASLLRGGWKLEIEGATNPALFRRDHARRLIRLIRSAR